MRITENALRHIIREELLESSYSRPHSRQSEVRVVSPFMWYEDRLFVVAEYERFVGGPKLKTGFYTSRGESVADTEHMAASWQPCLGINKTDGWIKKLPGKWAERGSLLDMVSGELSKRYDDTWQRQKRAELYSALRAKNRGMSRSELSETQIDPINDEFRKHGALFDRTFTNRSLESEQDIDDYREFADGFREGRTRRKGILREVRITPDNLPEGITFRLKVTTDGKMIIVRAVRDGDDLGWVEAHTSKGPRGTSFERTPCRGAFEVVNSGAYRRGLGPLLYDIAMEAATELGGGLMSDRMAVSDDAQRVWRKYQEDRPDVTYLKLDSEENEKTEPLEDNCNVLNAKAHAGDDWYDHPLAGVYRKPGMETIRRLLRMKRLQVIGMDL